MAVFFGFSLVTPAISGGVKPPKTLCLEVNGHPTYELGIKKGIKIMSEGSKVDMYTIHGLLGIYPTNGTGYMINDETFLFELFTTIGQTIAASGMWNVVDETGQVYMSVTDTDGLTVTQEDLSLCGTSP